MTGNGAHAKRRAVNALRRLILAHRHLASLLIVAALAVKLLVPAGYMVAPGPGHITVSICSGFGPKTMVIEIPGKAADHSSPNEHGKAEMRCAFSGLSTQALGPVDPILLVAALAFVMALALRLPRPSRISPTPYLRPQLRGPPDPLTS